MRVSVTPVSLADAGAERGSDVEARFGRTRRIPSVSVWQRGLRFRMRAEEWERLHGREKVFFQYLPLKARAVTEAELFHVSV